MCSCFVFFAQPLFRRHEEVGAVQVKMELKKFTEFFDEGLLHEREYEGAVGVFYVTIK